MLNQKLARPAVIDGRERAVTRRAAKGFAVYGPYERREAGVYRVDFELALVAKRPFAADRACAVIDVVDADVDVRLESRPVLLSELDGQATTFSLEFTLRRPCRLEYRVEVTGAARRAIGSRPRAIRVGYPPPIAELRRFGIGAPDPAGLQDEVRAVMRLLRPHRVRGFDKVRVGRAGDGGYVQVDDHAGLDVALSLGINDEVSWDLAMADRGLTIYQFDHTVDAPLPDDPRMVFAKRMISAERGPDRETLNDLVAAHDRGDERPNMILKMDIECSEWPVLQATSEAALSRFTQIVCELHAFQNLWDDGWRRDMKARLEELNRHYAVAHVHANICGGLSSVAGVVVPHVLEVTFANRAVYDFEETDETFPGPLDVSCTPDEADLYLGSFRF